MLKSLFILLAAAIFGGALVPAASAQTKIGSVDMKKVFESYFKTKDAEQSINEARNAAKKELEDRAEGLKKLSGEIQKLDEELRRPELSKDSKEAKNKQRDEKIGEFQALQNEIKEFQATREKQLQEQSIRMRANIVKDIDDVVQARVKAEQLDLVFDKSGMSLNGVPVVLYSKESYDFTSDVVTALNKNKSAAASSGDSTKPAAGGTAAKPKPKTP